MLSVVTNTLLVLLLIFVAFVAVGFVALWVVGRAKLKGLAAHEQRRLHALPSWEMDPYRQNVTEPSKTTQQALPQS